MHLAWSKLPYSSRRVNHLEVSTNLSSNLFELLRRMAKPIVPHDGWHGSRPQITTMIQPKQKSIVIKRKLPEKRKLGDNFIPGTHPLYPSRTHREFSSQSSKDLLRLVIMTTTATPLALNRIEGVEKRFPQIVPKPKNKTYNQNEIKMRCS